VRRYHTAKVKDQKEMTVVVYEGQDAEEEFKKDVARFMNFRHPLFLQLYGIVHSANNYASIFYDVLIPWMDMKSIYRESPMVLCYMYAYVSQEFKAASHYFACRFRSRLYSTGCTFFLRPSTGQLCIDLEGHNYTGLYVGLINTESFSPLSLLSSIDTKIIMDTLTVEQYHKISCSSTWAFCKLTPIEFLPTATVHLGAVYHTPGHHDLSNPVAIAPMLDIDRFDYVWRVDDYVNPHITESGWNRELGEKIELYLWAPISGSSLSRWWLSQANHVLNRLGVFSNTDNYALLEEISFIVELDPQPATPTDWHSLDAFLFLCPQRSFQVGPVSFKCPECVAYWSLDPLGVDRLSEAKASEFGFPTIRPSITGSSIDWGDTVYAGLRQFHQGKGFDPDSQDLARHLGHPLYQLYSDYDDSMNIDGESIYHIDLPAGYVLKRKYARGRFWSTYRGSSKHRYRSAYGCRLTRQSGYR
ncbi:hypothetical protein R3P38DRAFT_2523925, partial [Favolaschia claudopus]